MKPFLGIDATVNKQNIEFDGSELLVSAPSGTASDTLETLMDAQSEMTETAKLPKPARVVQFVCGIAGALIAAGIFKAMSSENAPGFRQLYTNVPWLVWLGGICIALWAVLTVLGYKKMKTVADSEENQYVQSKTEATANQIYAELSVPQDAPTVDVLSFRYKMKKGELKVCALGLEGAPYTSFEFRIFADGQNLYLANLDGKYRFPLSSLRKIHTVRKRIQVANWNKETPYNKGEYKAYKMAEDRDGTMLMKSYCVLEFEYDTESRGVYFPSYELPAFEKATGLTAE